MAEGKNLQGGLKNNGRHIQSVNILYKEHGQGKLLGAAQCLGISQRLEHADWPL